MDTVWISHPKLTDRDPIEVPASALQEHQRAGWDLVAAPDRRPETIQALIDGGWEPEDARKAVEAAMSPPSDPPPEPDPDPDSQSTEKTTEAPTSPAGASALPAESPQGRRASKGNK